MVEFQPASLERNNLTPETYKNKINIMKTNLSLEFLQIALLKVFMSLLNVVNK